MRSVFSSFKFSNVFLLAEIVILDYFLGEFLVRIPQKQPTFLTINDKQDDVSNMLQFFEVLRNGQNWAKNWFFAHFESFFLYTIVHPMRQNPRFCQLKDLLRYICGTFYQYSICGCENQKKSKILLKNKFSAKTASLGIINNVSPGSETNHKVLVKLSQKIFSGFKLGLNYHHGSNGHHKFSHSLY